MTDTETGTLLPAYAPPAAHGHPGRIVALGIGLAAALVAGAFALVSLAAADGSASAEAAVERLFAAVEQEDVLGVLESLPPGERGALRDGVTDLAGELQRLGILSDDLDLQGLSGLDIEVEGLTLASEELGPGITAVSITGGTATATATVGELPLGPVVEGFLDDPLGGAEPETATEDLGVGDPVLVAIEEAGGWHVSLFYSIAEAARRDAGAPLPPFGDGVRPEGASDPEAAVRALVDAAAALDLRRVVALTPPDEMRALHDYAPLFLDDAEAAIAEMTAGGEPLSIDVEHLGTSVAASGDVARVTITEVRASITAPWVGTVRYEWDGECTRVISEGGIEETTCLSELEEQGYPLDLGGYEPALVTVRGPDGWYVSPTRSAFGAVVDLLQVVDRDDLDDPEALLWGLLGAGLSGTMGLGPGSGPFGFDEPYTYEEEQGSTWEGSDELLDPGRDPALHDAAACFAPLEQLPRDATSEDVEKATAAVEACLEERQGG